MKCKQCGQEIKKKTNFDKLKELRLQDLDSYFEEINLCGKKCPFQKHCEALGEKGNSHFRCAINALQDWLSKTAK